MQPTRRRDRGNVLIVVSFVGLFAMALSGGLISHYAVSEARGIADSQAKLRVYWAMVGHIDYALSRMRQEHQAGAGWPSDLGEDGIQGVLLGYLDELDYGPNRNCRGKTVKSTENSRCSVWLYHPDDGEEHDGYQNLNPDQDVPDRSDRLVGRRQQYPVVRAADNQTGNT